MRSQLLAPHQKWPDFWLIITINKIQTEPVGNILMQLTQTATILSSLDLGSHILTHIKPQIKHIDHVEQAGFVVLKALMCHLFSLKQDLFQIMKSQTIAITCTSDAIAKSIAAGVEAPQRTNPKKHH